jgi:hypothetical protein
VKRTVVFSSVLVLYNNSYSGPPLVKVTEKISQYIYTTLDLCKSDMSYKIKQPQKKSGKVGICLYLAKDKYEKKRCKSYFKHNGFLL